MYAIMSKARIPIRSQSTTRRRPAAGLRVIYSNPTVNVILSCPSHPAVFDQHHRVGGEARGGAHDVRVNEARLHSLVPHLQPLVVDRLEGAQHNA